MQTIEVALDEKLLDAADLAAQQEKVNRSVFISHALTEHLRRLQPVASEERDRRGYEAHPQTQKESLAWEAVAAWPEH